jgi:hypothetical protein
VELREVPDLPAADLWPPVVAEAGDPFAELRVIHLLARLPRGEAVRVRDIVERLNHDHLDWAFSRAVVVAAIVQLQANWRADYRDHDGIRLADGPAGEELVIEQGSRVDPWIVRQVERRRAAAMERLQAFALQEGDRP